MERDPLQRLAGRCNKPAWELLHALRSYRQFWLMIEALNATPGALNEQAVAEAILDIEYPKENLQQPQIVENRAAC